MKRQVRPPPAYPTGGDDGLSHHPPSGGWSPRSSRSIPSGDSGAGKGRMVDEENERQAPVRAEGGTGNGRKRGQEAAAGDGLRAALD